MTVMESLFSTSEANLTAPPPAWSSSPAQDSATADVAGALLSSLGVIVVSELGDKTFFIALILSLQHSAWAVLAGAMTALALMTMLSACLGLVSACVPAEYVHYVSVALFIVFGLKMFYEAYQMSPVAGREEYELVQRSIDSRHANRDSMTSVEGGAEQGLSKVAGKLRRRRGFQLAWVCLEAFLMTFLAEWGDRSQITTVLLAAKQNVYGVVLGAVLGHFACTLIAVLGGRMVADRISLRAVTFCGGLVFLAFAAWALYTGVEADVSPDQALETITTASHDTRISLSTEKL